MADAQTPTPKKIVVVKPSPEEVNAFKVELERLLKKYNFYMEPILTGMPLKIEPIISIKKKVEVDEVKPEPPKIIKSVDEKAIN